MTTTNEEEGLEVHESKPPLNVPTGYHAIHVADIRDIVGKFGPQWEFSITFDEFPEEEPALAWAAPKLGTKAKLYGWATALLGRPLTIGEKISKQQLIGLPGRALVAEKMGAMSGEFFNYIENILPAKPVAKAKADTPALADNCFCGKAVSGYSPTGQALCAKHLKELSEEPPVEEMQLD